MAGRTAPRGDSLPPSQMMMMMIWAPQLLGHSAPIPPGQAGEGRRTETSTRPARAHDAAIFDQCSVQYWDCEAQRLNRHGLVGPDDADINEKIKS